MGRGVLGGSSCRGGVGNGGRRQCWTVALLFTNHDKSFNGRCLWVEEDEVVVNGDLWWAASTLEGVGIHGCFRERASVLAINLCCLLPRGRGL